MRRKNKSISKGIFASSFSVDLEWFASVIPSMCPVTLARGKGSNDSLEDVLNYKTMAKDRIEWFGFGGDGNGDDDDGIDSISLQPGMVVIWPPFPDVMRPRKASSYRPGSAGTQGCHHGKILLLYYPTHLRVVITSGNLTSFQWHENGNTVWVCDMPRVPGTATPRFSRPPIRRACRQGAAEPAGQFEVVCGCGGSGDARSRTRSKENINYQITPQSDSPQARRSKRFDDSASSSPAEPKNARVQDLRSLLEPSSFRGQLAHYLAYLIKGHEGCQSSWISYLSSYDFAPAEKLSLYLILSIPGMPDDLPKSLRSYKPSAVQEGVSSVPSISIRSTIVQTTKMRRFVEADAAQSRLVVLYPKLLSRSEIKLFDSRDTLVGTVPSSVTSYLYPLVAAGLVTIGDVLVYAPVLLTTEVSADRAPPPLRIRIWISLNPAPDWANCAQDPLEVGKSVACLLRSLPVDVGLSRLRSVLSKHDWQRYSCYETFFGYASSSIGSSLTNLWLRHFGEAVGFNFRAVSAEQADAMCDSDPTWTDRAAGVNLSGLAVLFPSQDLVKEFGASKTNGIFVLSERAARVLSERAMFHEVDPPINPPWELQTTTAVSSTRRVATDGLGGLSTPLFHAGAPTGEVAVGKKVGVVPRPEGGKTGRAVAVKDGISGMKDGHVDVHLSNEDANARLEARRCSPRYGVFWHSKVMLRLYKKEERGHTSSFGWLYTGSHNFSPPAWGRMRKVQSDSPRLFHSNFEIGVLFLEPPPQPTTGTTAAAAASPAPPHPKTLPYQHQTPLTDTSLSGDTDTSLAFLPSFCDRFPLPFHIPARPYEPQAEAATKKWVRKKIREERHQHMRLSRTASTVSASVARQVSYPTGTAGRVENESVVQIYSGSESGVDNPHKVESKRAKTEPGGVVQQPSRRRVRIAAVSPARKRYRQSSDEGKEGRDTRRRAAAADDAIINHLEDSIHGSGPSGAASTILDRDYREEDVESDGSSGSEAGASEAFGSDE
eukprot:Rmarinus@m.14592